MKKLLFIAMIFVSGFAIGQSDTLVKWTFPNNPDDSLADGGLAMNANSIITSWGGTSAINYTNTGATTYSARATGWDAGTDVKYWQVFFATNNFNTIKLSSKQRSSGTGPRDFKVQYRLSTLDTWADVPLAVVLDSNDWSHGVLTDIDLPAACENQDSVYLRWIMTTDVSVGGATVASTGSARIDDIIVIGAPISTGVSEIPSTHEVRFAQNADANTVTLFMNETSAIINIYDILGNQVFTTKGTSSNTVINTSNLEKGIYIFNIRFSDNSSLTKKVALL